MSSDGTKQTAVVYGENIWRSVDSGLNWTSVGLTKNWSGIAMSSDGQYQTVIVEFGNIWRSTDFGATWIEDTFIESNKDWWDITMNNDGTKQTVVANDGNIWRSNEIDCPTRSPTQSPTIHLTTSTKHSTGKRGNINLSYMRTNLPKNNGPTVALLALLISSWVIFLFVIMTVYYVCHRISKV